MWGVGWGVGEGTVWGRGAAGGVARLNPSGLVKIDAARFCGCWRGCSAAAYSRLIALGARRHRRDSRGAHANVVDHHLALGWREREKRESKRERARARERERERERERARERERERERERAREREREREREEYGRAECV